MNVGGGEAADQMVRMMLSGSEVVVRLGGSAAKNLLALSLALAKDHKKIHGKLSMGKMLKETRDIRQFPMTREQYQKFCKLAGKQKLLYSSIHDMDGKGKLIDVILPVTELDRANIIFERILYQQQTLDKTNQAVQKSEKTPKKESRSGQDSPDTRDSSSTRSSGKATKTANDRPSVEGRLNGYRAQLDKQHQSAPAKTKTKGKTK